MDDTLRLQTRVEELERERARLLALIEILRDITGSAHYTDIVQTVTRRLGHLFGLDRCSVFLTTGASSRTLHLVASYEDPSIRDYIIDLERYPELQRAIQTRQVVYIPDALAEPALTPVAPTLEGRRVRSITVVPMIASDQVIGALFLRTYREGPAISEEDIEFSRVVAEVTARGLRLAHRLEQLQSPQGTQAVARADRERAALIGFLGRLVPAFAERDPAFAEGMLARASSNELDRLVGVALTVIGQEAKGR